MAKPIPDGYHSITPTLTVRNGAEAIEFYKRAFGAQELMRFPGPDGKSLMHAELKIGDSVFMLSEEMPGSPQAPVSVGGPTGSLYLYVQDADAAFKQAVSAGAKVLMPVTDMFWGDRFGQVEDPSGHRWGIATHTRDLSPQEIERGAREFMASPGQSSGQSKK